MSLEKKLLLLGGGAILFIILAGALGWLRGPASSESSPVTPSSATNVKSKDQLAKENKRFEQCRAKLKKAEKLDLLHDLTIGPLPRVVVGPTFYTIPLEAKQGFADTVNCFLMTGQDSYVNFDLLDYQTGHVVAEYSYGKLSVK